MSDMPKLPVETMVAGLSDSDARIIRACFNHRKGCLRASKPYHDSDCAAGKHDAEFKACVNYVWRMLCFDYAGFAPHVCMPVTADFALHNAYTGCADRFAVVRAKTVVLDELVKRAGANLPIETKKGLLRWGRALGAF